MTRKLISTLSIIFLVAITPVSITTANPNAGSPFNLNGNVVSSLYNEVYTKQSLFLVQVISDDTSVSKGTQNWEEPQGNFFVVPGVVLGLIALALFFNRK